MQWSQRTSGQRRHALGMRSRSFLSLSVKKVKWHVCYSQFYSLFVKLKGQRIFCFEINQLYMMFCLVATHITRRSFKS